MISKTNFLRQISILLTLINILFFAGLFGHYHYLLDLINHFRPFLILLFLAVFTYKIRKKYHYTYAIQLLLLILLNFSTFPEFAFVDDPPADGESLKLAHFNVYFKNDDYARVAEIIQKEQPNIISFQEYTPAWHQALLPVLDGYELTCRPENRPFGICVATNIPVTDNEVVYLSSINESHQQPRSNPAIKLTVERNGKSIQFIFLHPAPPFSQQFFAYRNVYLQNVADQFKQYENLVVVGDLNITQWSPIYQAFESNLGLKNTLPGFENTWPNYLPFPIFQLDHILVSDHISIYQSAVLDEVGSDHYPVIANFGMK